MRCPLGLTLGDPSCRTTVRTGIRCRRTAGLVFLPPRRVSLRFVARKDEDDEERREGLVGVVGCPAEEGDDMYVEGKRI